MRCFIALAIVGFVAALKTCSNNGLGPCFNNLCPNGYSCVTNNLCCQDNCVINGCVDKVNPSTGISDCPRMASYCKNSAYLERMKEECPKTCGYCTSKCVDQVNPSTGRSDCPSMAAYCKHSAYAEMMARDCPKTCGKC